MKRTRNHIHCANDSKKSNTVGNVEAIRGGETDEGSYGDEGHRETHTGTAVVTSVTVVAHASGGLGDVIIKADTVAGADGGIGVGAG